MVTLRVLQPLADFKCLESYLYKRRGVQSQSDGKQRSRLMAPVRMPVWSIGDVLRQKGVHDCTPKCVLAHAWASTRPWGIAKKIDCVQQLGRSTRIWQKKM